MPQYVWDSYYLTINNWEISQFISQLFIIFVIIVGENFSESIYDIISTKLQGQYFPE